MSRSVLFDTETTGLDPATGDRVIEVAALELINDLPTGQYFHALIDPERDIPEDATRIHGFRSSDLEGKPKFADIVNDLIAFFGDARLIAHNAPFDFRFLEFEFARLGLPPLDLERMIDTLMLAKTRFPGMPNSLDALCRRFAIDLSQRTTHNALLDCRLLAEVYVELTGGRQRGLGLATEISTAPIAVYVHAGPRTARLLIPTEADLAAHQAMIARLRDPVWLAE
jgi:DNA polymerase III subunit epsilon